MPTVNVFYSDEKFEAQLSSVADELKAFTAKELTCGDISLEPNEVSVRIINTARTGMLAEIELEVTAHAFDERIKKQDEICLNIRKFMKQKIEVSEIRVWLLLPQLGHSWE
jgi:hypothetical protein